MSEQDSIARSVSLTSLGFGIVSALAPALFVRLYGLGAADPRLQAFVRMWGARNIAFSAVTLSARRPEDQHRNLTIATGLSLADAVIIAGAKGVPAGPRLMGTATGLAFTAACAAGLRRK